MMTVSLGIDGGDIFAAVFIIEMEDEVAETSGGGNIQRGGRMWACRW